MLKFDKSSFVGGDHFHVYVYARNKVDFFKIGRLLSIWPSQALCQAVLGQKPSEGLLGEVGLGRDKRVLRKEIQRRASDSAS